MKKSIVFLFVMILSVTLMAQSERFQKAMQTQITAMDSVRSADGWLELSNSFQRIADAEKTQWLPYYYAALSNVMQGLMMSNGQMGGMADKLDPLAAKAEANLNKAEALAGANAEIFCVKKMISNLRMMGDPMNRWQAEGPIAAAALQKAKSMDPSNPRVPMLEAQDKFYTPEEFGGSKTEAKQLFEEALKKFDSFKAASPLHPNWGRGQVLYFLSQLK